MPFRIIVAAERPGVVHSVCTVLRLLSLSCVITLTTTVSETVIEHLREQDAQLLILGYSRRTAPSVISQARHWRPRLRVLWIADADEAMPGADATLTQPFTALRLIEAVFKALKS